LSFHHDSNGYVYIVFNLADFDVLAIWLVSKMDLWIVGAMRTSANNNKKKRGKRNQLENKHNEEG